MEEGDIVLCKVESVTNTITFVSMPNGQEGTIVSSEIAPGRIKLMRQYVVPNKQIVCKVLGVDGDHIKLSLRRVNSKERKEIMQAFKQSQAIDVAFRQILKEDEKSIKEKILKDFENLAEFIKSIKEDDSIISKYIPEEKQEAIKKIARERKKNQQLTRNIKIKCIGSDGLIQIKNILSLENPNVSVTYISAGNFKLKLIVDDFKQGKKEMVEIIEKLEKKAKESNCEFYTNEEK